MLNWVHVSKTTSPVTQVADVEVKSASKNDTHSPLRFVIGKHSIIAPINIISANPTDIMRVALHCLKCKKFVSIKYILFTIAPLFII